MYLQSEQILAAFPAARLAHDLRTLFIAATGLGTIRDRDALLTELLTRILEVVPGDCGAVLIANDSGDGFDYTRARRREADGPVPVSQTITRRVLQERVSFLSNDATADVPSSRSVVSARVRSVLCVPLMALVVQPRVTAL